MSRVIRRGGVWALGFLVAVPLLLLPVHALAENASDSMFSDSDDGLTLEARIFEEQKRQWDMAYDLHQQEIEVARQSAAYEAAIQARDDLIATQGDYIDRLEKNSQLLMGTIAQMESETASLATQLERAEALQAEQTDPLTLLSLAGVAGLVLGYVGNGMSRRFRRVARNADPPSGAP